MHSGFIHLFITALEWSVWKRWDLILSQKCCNTREWSRSNYPVLVSGKEDLRFCFIARQDYNCVNIVVLNKVLIRVLLCTCCRAVRGALCQEAIVLGNWWGIPNPLRQAFKSTNSVQPKRKHFPSLPQQFKTTENDNKWEHRASPTVRNSQKCIGIFFILIQYHEQMC